MGCVQHKLAAISAIVMFFLNKNYSIQSDHKINFLLLSTGFLTLWVSPILLFACGFFLKCWNEQFVEKLTHLLCIFFFQKTPQEGNHLDKEESKEVLALEKSNNCHRLISIQSIISSYYHRSNFVSYFYYSNIIIYYSCNSNSYVGECSFLLPNAKNKINNHN